MLDHFFVFQDIRGFFVPLFVIKHFHIFLDVLHFFADFFLKFCNFISALALLSLFQPFRGCFKNLIRMDLLRGLHLLQPMNLKFLDRHTSIDELSLSFQKIDHNFRGELRFQNLLCIRSVLRVLAQQQPWNFEVIKKNKYNRRISGSESNELRCGGNYLVNL